MTKVHSIKANVFHCASVHFNVVFCFEVFIISHSDYTHFLTIPLDYILTERSILLLFMLPILWLSH